MTNEDKKIVADYMGWAQYKYPPYYLNIKGDIESHHFDLNDAGLVVQEMQKRGDWRKVTDWTVYQTNQHLPGVRKGNIYYYDANFIAYLFNAENFFNAMAAWLREVLTAYENPTKSK